MNKAALITEKKASRPILIVDKEGGLGKNIAEKLRSEFLVVFVSKQSINEENIVSIPYLRNIPSIPDNKYSQIIIILEDEVSKQTIKVFQKKAEKDDAKLSIILNKKNFDKKISKSVLDSYENTNILILGEIFSDNFIYEESSKLSELIIEAKNYGRLEIPNDGSLQQSPVFLQDAIEAILEAIFVEEKYSLFYIFPKNNTTLLSLALMLKKKNPHLKIDFVKDKQKISKTELLEGGKYMLKTPYNFEDVIGKIDLEKISVENVRNKSGKKKSMKFSFLPIFVFLICLVLIPLLSTLLFLFLGNSLLQKQNYLSLKSYEISEKSLEVAELEFNFLNLKNKVGFLEKSLSLGKQNAQIDIFLENSWDNINKLLSGKSISQDKDFSNALLNLNNAYYAFQNESQQGNTNYLEQSLDALTSVEDFYSQMLGFYQEKTYLILFQNSSKLMPGGGQIEFYGLLSINKGKITNLEIKDAQGLDKTLTSRVEPPFAIRRYLPSVNWHFTNSNFDVDFSKDAIASAVFLNSQTHQNVDGVIGVDSYFIKNLLMLTGNIIIDNKSINSGNLFIEVDQNPSKDFKENFYNALFEKLANANSSYKNLILAVVDSAVQKHILFAFNDRIQQLGFSVNGLGSSLLDLRENLSDFLGISEANFGSNSIITRSISQEINIDDNGAVSEKVEVNFKNHGNNLYKNYIRFILPINSEVSQISIDNTKEKIIPAIEDPSVYESKKFIGPSGLEIEKYNEEKTTIYGFLLNVGSKNSEKITINYTLSKNFNLDDNKYSLRLFKQPGIDYYPYKLTLNVPNGYKVLSYPKNFIQSENGGTLSLDISKDSDLNFKIFPK